MAMMWYRKTLLVACGVLMPMASLHAAPAPQMGERKNMRVAVVYGDDQCPPKKEGEIVVCARQPESERFRIPNKLRSTEVSPRKGNMAWAARAEMLDEVSPATGINKCSVQGPAGWTGCFGAWMRQQRAEARAAKREADALPGGKNTRITVDGEDIEDGQLQDGEQP